MVAKGNPRMINNATKEHTKKGKNAKHVRNNGKIIPSNPAFLLSKCTSTAAIFTQAKCVGEALKQNAG
jgi:hypothetical protein